MMRKIKHILSLALVVLAFTACSQEETDALPGSKQPLTLTATIAGGADTRATVNGDWEGDEKIALQVDAGQYYDYTVDKDGRMTGNFYWQSDGQSISIQGYCPSGRISDNTECSIETAQNIEENYQNSDLLCSDLQQNISENNLYISLAFYHQTAKVIVNVITGGYLSNGTNNNVSMTINDLYTSATFTGPTNGTGIIWAGTWTNHNNQKAITPHQAATTSGNAATFEALVIPQTVSTGTLFQFYVGEVGPFTYEVPAGGIIWETGMKYTYNVTLKAEGQTVTINSINAGGWGNGGSHDLETE